MGSEALRSARASSSFLVKARTFSTSEAEDSGAVNGETPRLVALLLLAIDVFMLPLQGVPEGAFGALWTRSRACCCSGASVDCAERKRRVIQSPQPLRLLNLLLLKK